MRLFIGVELSAGVRAGVAAIAGRLREGLARAAPRLEARWVAPENLHVTLWFLGEVTGEQHAAIAAALASPPWTVPAFDLAPGGCGAFPPSGPPRVFWVGVREGAPHMRALHAALAARLEPLGYSPERRTYSPHVTVARVKSAPRAAGAVLRPLLSDTAIAGTDRVHAVTLFRSRLSPRGAAYEPLLRVPLA